MRDVRRSLAITPDAEDSGMGLLILRVSAPMLGRRSRAEIGTRSGDSQGSPRNRGYPEADPFESACYPAGDRRRSSPNSTSFGLVRAGVDLRRVLSERGRDRCLLVV